MRPVMKRWFYSENMALDSALLAGSLKMPKQVADD